MRSTRLSTRAMAVLTLAVGTMLGPVALGPEAAHAQVGSLVRAAPEAGNTPLAVTMNQLSPSTVPARGVVTISGTVANRSEEDWTDLTVYPFVSAEPITTRDDLAAAADSEPEAIVGERLTDPGIPAAVRDLGPGESTAFTLTIPSATLQQAISGEPGVYWIGVHALGSNAEGTDAVADGRARSFLPLVPPDVARRASVPVSVVLPLRERARRAVDGSLNGPARWVSLTGPEGRLTRLVDFAASAGSAPVTWLLDPAVLDALQDFGQGNPPLSLGPDRPRDQEGEDGDGGEDGEEGDGEGEPSTSPSPSQQPTPVSGAPSEEERARATSVLEGFLGLARTGNLLTLGYADPDVASLTRRRDSLMRRSEDLAGRRMEAFGLTGSPVVAPPNGYFDPDLLDRVPAGALMLLGDQGELEQPPLSRLPTGQELVLGDDRVVDGGPGPTSSTTPLALRQRLVSEAALEVTQGAGVPVRPIVASFPATWNPGPRWREADFFGGLQVPWLQLTPVPRGAGATFEGELPYGRAQLAEEIPAANVDASRTLTHTSTVLGHLLANDNDVTERLTGAALQSSAYSARPTLRLAAEQVLELDTATRAEMGRVEVTGTDFVTLSGGSGSLTVTLVNGLEQPITVGLRARSDSPDVKVELPDPVNMQGGERTTLRLQVSSPVGVHDVTLSPVTTQGEDAGSPLTFSLRTSQVGRLIWYIIIAGGALLAVMVARRIVLRIRLNRWRVEEE